MWADVGFVLGGGCLLLAGGELLVRGAAALARSLGVSAMVVGLTVVAYGTSAPEFVVSVSAAWRGNAAIGTGNIIGSNILNVLLVLGAAAMLCPIRATAGFVRREAPILVVVSALAWAAAADGRICRIESIALLLLLVVYNVLAVRLARRERAAVLQAYDQTLPPAKPSVAWLLAMIVVGLGLLMGGSELFLRGAVNVAASLGVSQMLIGLTLVALGTSLPELTASVIAAWHKHADLCLGNIVGSNIFNLLWIGGASGLVGSSDGKPGLPFDDQSLHVHLPVMMAASVVLWLMAATGLRVSRREGAVLLLSYACYVGYTILHRTA